jgi:hypothetical protein
MNNLCFTNASLEKVHLLLFPIQKAGGLQHGNYRHCCQPCQK